ncbi:hypothetical protein ACG9XQ_05690 [Acinetobacter baumannii]|uniref:hypothetical protein n=1 Tax=Acinetobacter baumannii TaxID=470 RepID=UPI003AF88E4F
MSERCFWTVSLCSTPGPYAQYEGDVRVWAYEDADEDTLFRAAVKELSRGAFFDRPSLAFWKLIEVKKN